jgi:phosphoglycolate phosphatase-like HAD superfamily hydrolase
MPETGSLPASAMVLFDIDGTLIRRAGPHHRAALVEAIRLAAHVETSVDHIPTHGMLDCDIVAVALRGQGATEQEIRRAMPEIIRRAQIVYRRTCPDLRRKVCPGVRRLLQQLKKRGIPMGLVTGNFAEIAWRKMHHAGLRSYFWFGAFAEMAATRAELVGIALREARRNAWIHGRSCVSLIGDHPNDIAAAKLNGIRSIAVATGLSTREELAAYNPDSLVADLRSLSVQALISCTQAE